MIPSRFVAVLHSPEQELNSDNTKRVTLNLSIWQSDNHKRRRDKALRKDRMRRAIPKKKKKAAVKHDARHVTAVQQTA